jgi:thiol-disulfide isomerase/thioredoxin
MPRFLEVVSRASRPYYNYIVLVLVILLFIIVGHFAYNYLRKKNQNQFKDVANANRQKKEVTIYFFHVDWCPHCKTAKPEWSNFSRKMDGKEINGYKLKCMDVNCTDENSEVSHFVEEFNIESYPTIKMVKDNNKIEFDSRVKANLLEQFATTMLNE